MPNSNWEFGTELTTGDGTSLTERGPAGGLHRILVWDTLSNMVLLRMMFNLWTVHILMTLERTQNHFVDSSQKVSSGVPEIHQNS